MKKHLLLSLFLCVPILSIAQKCKFDEEKNDPFSGGIFRLSAHKIGPMSWNWNFTLEQNGDQYFISVRMLRSGKMEDIYKTGQKIMLKLANGKVLELIADKDFPPGYAISSDGIIWTNYIPKFEVDKILMTELSSSPITDLKTTLGSQDILLPKITEKQSKNIAQTASCMIK